MLSHTRRYFLAGALALMGIVLARQEWMVFEREARLNAEGVVTQGSVRNVRTSKHESIALVEYAVPGEGVRVRAVPVSRPFAHEIAVSGKTARVKVRYLPQDHEVVDILGASQSSGWGWVIVFMLFALSAWSVSSGWHAKNRIGEENR